MKERETFRAGVKNQVGVATRSAFLGSAKPAPALRAIAYTIIALGSDISRAFRSLSDPEDLSALTLWLAAAYLLAHLLSAASLLIMGVPLGF